ncbi:hypothetical protein ONQ97_27640, partial [Salmonella enterica subsp. enterica serovar Virginia]|nr:hypothetical protein [Salmonella enterica subsp. enterica serovar Virginia]
LFALELAPSVILSLGIIAITDGLGGLRAAQQLMTPILKPLLGNQLAKLEPVVSVLQSDPEQFEQLKEDYAWSQQMQRDARQQA